MGKTQQNVRIFDELVLFEKDGLKKRAPMAVWKNKIHFKFEPSLIFYRIVNRLLKMSYIK